MPGKYNNNINSGKSEASKNMFNVALNLELQSEEQLNWMDDARRKLRQIAMKIWNGFGLFRYCTKANVIWVFKHILALLYALTILYIMYYILDMAFGPKDYKNKKDMRRLEKY